MTTADYLSQLQQDKDDLVDNLEAKGITGLTGDETFTELVPEVLNIPSGSSGGFTGHYDTTGLTSINWTSEDIAYYQDNAVLWNSELDNDYKLRSDELQGTAGATARFLPKTTSVNHFQNYYSLIGLPSLNITRTDWKNMFYYCYNLITIPQFDTSNVTTLQNAFGYCHSLIKIPLLNTGNVSNMSTAFQRCENLRTIPQLNTSNVTNMANMFNGCTSLTYIPELNTSKVINFQTTFGGCYNLSDSCLYNILEMCRKATSYSGTKTLSYLGFDTTVYSTRISALSNYQAFVNAGWSIQ